MQSQHLGEIQEENYSMKKKVSLGVDNPIDIFREETNGSDSESVDGLTD